MKSKNRKIHRTMIELGLLSSLIACAPTPAVNPVVPALEYANKLKEEYRNHRQVADARMVAQYNNVAEQPDMRAKLQFVDGQNDANPDLPRPELSNNEVLTNDPSFEVYESSMKHSRDYNGPLSLGDPGVTASLWRESRGANDIFRDQRAWQPMDLITILVTESSEGSKEADTETKSESTVQAAINQLFSFDDDIVEANPGKVDPSNLVQATTTNEFKGEGETTRKGTLTAKISAMVAEVLPSGILRIEGQKIISVNSEEQVMVISGLVRPRDINSLNEIDSSKIANMRIDYYGNGIVGEAQYGGWLGRLMRIIWPF